MTKKDMIKRLTKIKGIGEAKAESLYDNGFNNDEKLRKAKVADLIKVEGINETIAQTIIDDFKDEPKKSKTEIKKDKTEEKKKLEKKQETKKEKVEKLKEEQLEKEIIEEKKEYIVKKKPKLEDDIKYKLRIRKQIKKRTPDFLREEWYRYKRIPKNWRKPDGITSKMRINKKYRPSMARIGFRGPREVRGLHSSGFEEIIVFNSKDLESLDPKTQAARIGGSVGYKKRLEIEKKAEKLEIRILNL